MTSRRSSATPKPRRRPASTPEARENQMVSLAIDLAERQLDEGTASAQVITHYLKLGSTREQLEQERLRADNELLQAKVESLKSAKRVEELYEDALNAMRAYSGKDPIVDDREEYDEY
jgi:uncharacterized protein YcaQ